MSAILQKIGQSVNVQVNYFIADSDADLEIIDVTTSSLGSECYVIESGTTYVLNSEKEWKAKPNAGGNGGGSGAVDLNEGVIS